MNIWFSSIEDSKSLNFDFRALRWRKRRTLIVLAVGLFVRGGIGTFLLLFKFEMLNHFFVAQAESSSQAVLTGMAGSGAKEFIPPLTKH